MGLLDILQQYSDPARARTDRIDDDFDEVVRQSAAARARQRRRRGVPLRCDAAVRPDDRRPVRPVGSAAARRHPEPARPGRSAAARCASIAGGVLGRVLGGGAGNAAPTITPEQASQLSPADAAAIAEHAEKKDPSILDRAGEFYAEHPQLVKGLGAAALAIALGRMHSARRWRAPRQAVRITVMCSVPLSLPAGTASAGRRRRRPRAHYIQRMRHAVFRLFSNEPLHDPTAPSGPRRQARDQDDDVLHVRVPLRHPRPPARRRGALHRRQSRPSDQQGRDLRQGRVGDHEAVLAGAADAAAAAQGRQRARRRRVRADLVGARVRDPRRRGSRRSAPPIRRSSRSSPGATRCRR